MKSGRRNTCYQPDEYIGTIYFLGPCIVFGAYVEDQYTIESYLQKYLLEIGYPYHTPSLLCQNPYEYYYFLFLFLVKKVLSMIKYDLL